MITAVFHAYEGQIVEGPIALDESVPPPILRREATRTVHLFDMDSHPSGSDLHHEILEYRFTGFDYREIAHYRQVW